VDRNGSYPYPIHNSIVGGREEGREDEKLASARRMLAVGKFSPEDISVALDLPISRIEAIRQEQLAH